MDYTFSKPITFEGNEYVEIQMDFDSLTGKDIIDAEQQHNSTGLVRAPVKEFSKEFLAIIASKASKQTVEFMYALPAKDFSKVTMLAQNFLMG